MNEPIKKFIKKIVFGLIDAFTISNRKKLRGKSTLIKSIGNKTQVFFFNRQNQNHKVNF